MDWISAFGQGEAMLAAAGSVHRHPHWEDDELARARWDGDIMHFNSDLLAVQQLLIDILDAHLTSDAEIQERAAPFWGDVSAWYTVGYQMAPGRNAIWPVRLRRLSPRSWKAAQRVQRWYPGHDYFLKLTRKMKSVGTARSANCPATMPAETRATLPHQNN